MASEKTPAQQDFASIPGLHVHHCVIISSIITGLVTFTHPSLCSDRGRAVRPHAKHTRGADEPKWK